MAQYGSLLCIRHHYGHNMAQSPQVQASIYGPMLCIRHYNTAQTCASCINMHGYRCGASMTLYSCASCINMAWLITLNLPHHTCPLPFLLFCLRLTLEEEGKMDRINRVLHSCRFATFALLSGDIDMARAALENDRYRCLKACKTRSYSRVIANTSIGAAILFSCIPT